MSDNLKAGITRACFHEPMVNRPPSGNKACRDGFSVLYKRASRLFADLAQARGEGRLLAS